MVRANQETVTTFGEVLHSAKTKGVCPHKGRVKFLKVF